MTKELLPSDLDLARRLMRSGWDDASISTRLSLRGVSDAIAIATVNALRKNNRCLPWAPAPGPERSFQTQGSRSSRNRCHDCRDKAPDWNARDYRRRVRRATKLATNLVFGMAAFAFLLACVSYVSYLTWHGAMSIKERRDAFFPDWLGSVWRWQNELPETACDKWKVDN